MVVPEPDWAVTEERAEKRESMVSDCFILNVIAVMSLSEERVCFYQKEEDAPSTTNRMLTKVINSTGSFEEGIKKEWKGSNDPRRQIRSAEVAKSTKGKWSGCEEEQEHDEGLRISYSDDFCPLLSALDKHDPRMLSIDLNK